MKYYILAGEASGDLHGSNLIKSIKKIDSNANIRCYGGDKMQAAGATLVGHYKDRAFMGFAEVIKNLFKIFKIIKACKQDIAAFEPDALIFIDNSGFNLRIAKWAKPIGLETFYYISPQVWASRPGRVQQIKKNIDHMYVVLPFVKSFYEKYDYAVKYVGHPLVDAIAAHQKTATKDFKTKYQLSNAPIIALLPGSRKQEITAMLGVMLQVCKEFASYQVIIAAAPSQEIAFYEELMAGFNVKIVANETYNILAHADLALVTSGTATLETALFKVPQVVCYKGSALSYAIAKRIVKLKYISLVNLIMDKTVVKELIQAELNVVSLKQEMRQLLHAQYRQKMLEAYDDLEEKLGGTGASDTTALEIVNALRK